MEVNLRNAIGGIAARRRVRIDVDHYTFFGPEHAFPPLSRHVRTHKHRVLSFRNF